MGQTRRRVRATFDLEQSKVEISTLPMSYSVTVGHETMVPETVTRPCSRCGKPHSHQHYYCPPCRALYMAARRIVWKAARESGKNMDDARPISEGETHE